MPVPTWCGEGLRHVLPISIWFVKLVVRRMDHSWCWVLRIPNFSQIRTPCLQLRWLARVERGEERADSLSVTRILIFCHYVLMFLTFPEESVPVQPDICY